MEFGVAEEHRLLIATARSFVEREMIPHEDAVERERVVPPDLARQIHDRAIRAGLAAANMPASVGGGGLDHLGQAYLNRELGRTTWALIAHVPMPSRILMACAGDQVERYLLPSVRGERKDCFALTEPGAGSDAASIATRAMRDGGDWVLNGTKHFISGGQSADFAIVFAVTGVDETANGPRKRITAFLVDKGTKGFEARPGYRAVSYRGYPNAILAFQDCRLGPGQILGEEGKGFDLANEWLTTGRVGVAAVCCGKADRAIGLATEWAATRRQFGRRIGEFQGVSFRLADMVTELRAADLLTRHAAWKADRGTMTSADAARAKLYASEMLGRVTDGAIQIFGGMGLMEESPLERLWRDARVERIWDGTSEIQRHIIARDLLRPHEA
jgi:alkylation response protein AidB-like acyl-CoA dehydrogenase